MDALIIGRYNIPHLGHLSLVQQALAETDGTVYVAIVGNGNISAEEREFQFRHLALSQRVSLERVQFIFVTNAYQAFEHMLQLETESGATFVAYCGEDRFRSYNSILTRMPESLATVRCTARPESSISSTWCRSASRDELISAFGDVTYADTVLALAARGA